MKLCQCGHERDVHQHNRRGSDCGFCYPVCKRYRRRWWWSR